MDKGLAWLHFNNSPSGSSAALEWFEEYLSHSFRDVVIKGKEKVLAPIPEACHALPSKGGFMVDVRRLAPIVVSGRGANWSMLVFLMLKSS